MPTRRTVSTLVAVVAIVAGAAIGVWLLSTNGSGEASTDPEFERELEFFKRGREDFAVCVSDYTTGARTTSELTAHTREAFDENKATLWRNTFLEAEPIVVESPCPTGPTFDENTRDQMDHLGNIPIVEEPGPYILYVHILDEAHFALIEDLKLGGRILTQELADFTPNQVAGYEPVAVALHVTAAEFDDPTFLARQVSEALGCTEDCARSAEADQ